MKLNYEDKIKIVKLHEEEISCSDLAIRFCVSKEQIYRYCRLYRQYGEEILKRKIFKIQRSMIIKRMNDYEKFGYNGLIKKKNQIWRMNS